MGWYDDNSRKTYVATYKDERSMRADVEAAAKHGFVTQAMARSGNQWTVTYQRDDRAWARIQVEKALSQLGRERTTLQQANAKIDDLGTDLTSRFHAARDETTNPIRLERRLLRTITSRVAARQSANTQRHVVTAAYVELLTAQNEAAHLRVEVPQANIDVEAELQLLRQDMSEEAQRLQEDQALQQAQQRVVNEVREWQKVVGDRWGAYNQIARGEKVAATSASVALAQTGSADSDDLTAPAALADQSAHQMRLDVLESRLREREAALLGALEARDNLIGGAIR